MKTEMKWTIITIIVLWISFIGFCYQAKAQEEMIPQTPQEIMIYGIDAVQLNLSPEFMEGLARARKKFDQDIERNPTDMGIVIAQKYLAYRIDYLLLKYESDRIKIDQAIMDIDAEKLQADEEEREMDRQGIWKDMTNNN